ncbi:GTP pyrophosphokinase, partial [Mycolicibacter algericus]|uniref:GTP pyrophosphokinase n=1 Tax=Mycolicibacter algericus TaxID=1288388 RepID=UPI003908914B
MGLETAREGRWGYASRHLLVGVEGEQQPASIQVRTVLQHAWAEFEHDIRYKGSIPAEHAPDLDRRFTLAAGLLELADSEFTAIRERLRVAMVDRDDTDDDSSDPRIATPVLASPPSGNGCAWPWSTVTTPTTTRRIHGSPPPCSRPTSGTGMPTPG